MHPKRLVLLLALLCLPVMLTAGAAAAYWILYPALPEPAMADREQLLRWLVLRDLAEEPAATRAALARRLEEEFGGSSDWQFDAKRLTESQRERLGRNLPLVLEPWFLDKVEHYGNLRPDQRRTFLDRFLDLAAKWRAAEALKGPFTIDETPSRSTTPAIGQQWLTQVEQWKVGQDASQCQQIDQFIVAVQSRWLMRQVSEWLSWPRPASPRITSPRITSPGTASHSKN